MAIDDETQAEKYAEDYQLPGTEELRALEAWTHRHAIILKAGRVSHIAPPGLDEEQKEEYMSKVAEKDAVVDRFRGINDDTPVEGYKSAWLSKLVGDP